MSILNDILVEFVREKNELINKYICGTSKYVYKSDIEEIKGLPMWMCLKILTKMAETKFDLDVNICPWCLMKEPTENNNCGYCGYGERHLYCDNKLSTYQYITRAIHRMGEIKYDHCCSITSIPGMKELVTKTNNKTLAVMAAINRIDNTKYTQ